MEGMGFFIKCFAINGRDWLLFNNAVFGSSGFRSTVFYGSFKKVFENFLVIFKNLSPEQDDNMLQSWTQ